MSGKWTTATKTRKARLLRELFQHTDEANIDDKAIAQKIGVSRETIRRWRLKTTLPIHDDQIRTLISSFSNGQASSEIDAALQIAEILGRLDRQVARRVLDLLSKRYA